VRLAHLHVRDRDGAASTDAIARTVGFRDACSMLSAVRNIAGCGTMAEFLALSPMRLSRCLEAALRADPRPDF
jgi:hypothetical protein